MSYTKKPDSDELGTHSRRASYDDQSAANNSVRFFDRKVKQKQFYIERTARNCRGWILDFCLQKTKMSLENVKKQKKREIWGSVP